ncbi:MAG: hypothetical protein [Bacteriophage sp.]|nr:MAG: hypothetical protein [Bacteriophage sp.]
MNILDYMKDYVDPNVVKCLGVDHRASIFGEIKPRPKLTAKQKLFNHVYGASISIREKIARKIAPWIVGSEW